MEGNLHREQFLGDPNDPKIRKMLWKTKINHGISRTCFSKSGAVFEACSTYFNCRQTRLGKNQSAPGVLEWKSWLQRSESTSSRASSSKVEASNPPRDSFEDWPGINRDHKQRTACAYIYMYMYIIFIYMPNKASSTYSKYRYIRYKSNTSGFTSSKTDCKGSMATNCWMSSYISQPKKNTQNRRSRNVTASRWQSVYCLFWTLHCYIHRLVRIWYTCSFSPSFSWPLSLVLKLSLSDTCRL